VTAIPSMAPQATEMGWTLRLWRDGSGADLGGLQPGVTEGLPVAHRGQLFRRRMRTSQAAAHAAGRERMVALASVSQVGVKVWCGGNRIDFRRVLYQLR
jgi:hypothetical protein